MPQQLLPFLLVVAVLTVTPGPDWAIVLRNGVRGGSSAAWWTGLGCCAGIALHATAAVLGLSAVLAASTTAYTVLKVAGALYLVYLGARALWLSRRAPAPVSAMPETAPVGRIQAFRHGVLNNLLNPKIALLFLTLLPQFVAANEPRVQTSAVLALTFLATAVAWWRAFSLLVGVLGRGLARDRVRVALDRLTGCVLVGLGVRVALERA
ncbi:threonine transporter RhtB [Longimycelium tulufanense]|uniref:Threonine transporter RhtB n=1 Tax=Longimycelium tulufanense TaxID=907463 RepID=A0A8J3C9N7_9PSEU|nr:LysE family translocator [Longimycelium tulufanense]GGM35226.1 threonine transporter RhtB [Longimycelium tulufanense]